uniref:ML1A2 n=1 Tax=Haliotis laevigata TaxID=36097 RepID=A0A2H4H0M8_HALLA|nr:ML1A2 [Haliotis laevigata]
MNSLIFLAVLCSTAYVAFAQNTPIRPPFLPGPPAAGAPRLPSKGVAGLARTSHKSLLNNPYLMMMGDKYFEVAALDMLMDPSTQVSPIQRMVIAKNADLNPIDMMFADRFRGAQSAGMGMRSLYVPAMLSMM